MSDLITTKLAYMASPKSVLDYGRNHGVHWAADSFLDFSIDTERLLLRACQMEDADALTALMTPEISKWVAAWPTPLSQQDTESILRNNIEAMQQGAVFAAVVVAKDSSDIIGWCKLDIAGDCAELGYWIGEEYQRQGFAMELLQGAIDFAFSQLDVVSVRAGAQVANTASLALLAKIGMTRDGIEAVWAPARQRYEDCEFWSLRAPDKGLSDD